MDYNMIMIARKEHENRNRRVDGIRPAHRSMATPVRRALGHLGDWMIAIGSKLKAQHEALPRPVSLQEQR